MPACVQPLASDDTDGRSQDDVGKYRQRQQTSRPGGNGTAIHCLTFRREHQRMVVFRGSPQPDLVQLLRQSQAMIGLVLAPDELARMHRLDGYSYVFIGARSCATSAFAAAVADLKRANWSIDPDTTWPVIVRYGSTKAIDGP